MKEELPPQTPSLEENAQNINLGHVGVRNPVLAWSRTTFAALQVRNFRLFYIGQGLSLVGSWMRRTALGWLVYSLTGSMALLGTVMALTFLPLFFVSPIAGSLADRLDKRKVIIASQIVACLTSATMATLIWTDLVQIWHVMALALLGGTAFAFEVPTRQAFVVEMVGRDRLYNAIALNSALVNMARIIGPALAGIVMGTVGIGWAFALDSMSYLIVIGTLISMRLPRFVPPKTKRSQLELLREGALEVWRNRPVRMVMVLLMLTGIFGWTFEPLLPAIAQDVLRIGEGAYGLLFSMFGIGAIGGALYTASRSEGVDKTRQLFAGVWLMVAGVLLFSISRSPLAMAVALVLAGFGGVHFISTGNTVVQLNVADSIRGRVMGIWALAFGGSLPIGSFLAGNLADVLARLPHARWIEGTPPGLQRTLLEWFAALFGGPASAYLTVGLCGLTLLVVSLAVRRWTLSASWEQAPETRPAEAL